METVCSCKRKKKTTKKTLKCFVVHDDDDDAVSLRSDVMSFQTIPDWCPFKQFTLAKCLAEQMHPPSFLLEWPLCLVTSLFFLWEKAPLGQAIKEPFCNGYVFSQLKAGLGDYQTIDLLEQGETGVYGNDNLHRSAINLCVHKHWLQLKPVG